jgi:hypothetical protein
VRIRSILTILLLGSAAGAFAHSSHGHDAPHLHDDVQFAHAGHGHDGPHIHNHQTVAQGDKGAAKVTGQGDMVFSYDEALTNAMPAEMKKFEPRMHGSFHEDAETGIVYTGLPNYGLVSISQDLKTWKKVGDDPRLKGNVHGLAVYKHKGKTQIALAMNNNQKVLIVDTAGNILQDLPKPNGSEFNFEPANAYYKNPKARFNVTDTTYLDGTLYAVTGYSPGDFVLTATEKDGKWAWGPIAWGGKGKADGQFTTSHGVLAKGDEIIVANRDAFQVKRFTKDGKHLETLPGLPPKSKVCNVGATDDYLIFCPLFPLAKEQKTAPILAYADGKVVSTIVAGDLGVPILKNIHGAHPHYVKDANGNKHLYILIHGWNKGKYIVLKHEPEQKAAAILEGPRSRIVQ